MVSCSLCTAFLPLNWPRSDGEWWVVKVKTKRQTRTDHSFDIAGNETRKVVVASTASVHIINITSLCSAPVCPLGPSCYVQCVFFFCHVLCVLAVCLFADVFTRKQFVVCIVWCALNVEGCKSFKGIYLLDTVAPATLWLKEGLNQGSVIYALFGWGGWWRSLIRNVITQAVICGSNLLQDLLVINLKQAPVNTFTWSEGNSAFWRATSPRKVKHSQCWSLFETCWMYGVCVCVSGRGWAPPVNTS